MGGPEANRGLARGTVPSYDPRMPDDDPGLEALRAASGLAVDDEGRFLHRGEPVTHLRTLEALWRSLERAPDGRWQVRIGRERAWVEVGETPWAVQGVRLDADPPVLRLSGGREEPLDPATLAVGADGVLRCTLRDGERARFTRAAQIALGLALEEDPAGSGGFHLTLGGTRWPVRSL
jgi:hypothetical protein